MQVFNKLSNWLNVLQEFSDNNQSKNLIPNFLNPLGFLATDEFAVGVRYQEAGVVFCKSDRYSPLCLAIPAVPDEFFNVSFMFLRLPYSYAFEIKTVGSLKLNFY